MNWGKAVSFRWAERESDGGEVRDGEREGLELEREERARDSEMVAIAKKTKNKNWELGMWDWDLYVIIKQTYKY